MEFYLLIKNLKGKFFFKSRGIAAFRKNVFKIV